LVFGGKFLRVKEISRWRIFGNFSEGVKKYNVLDNSPNFAGFWRKISEGERNNKVENFGVFLG